MSADRKQQTPANVNGSVAKGDAKLKAIEFELNGPEISMLLTALLREEEKAGWRLSNSERLTSVGGTPYDSVARCEERAASIRRIRAAIRNSTRSKIRSDERERRAVMIFKDDIKPLIDLLNNQVNLAGVAIENMKDDINLGQSICRSTIEEAKRECRIVRSLVHKARLAARRQRKKKLRRRPRRT